MSKQPVAEPSDTVDQSVTNPSTEPTDKVSDTVRIKQPFLTEIYHDEIARREEQDEILLLVPGQDSGSERKEKALQAYKKIVGAVDDLAGSDLKTHYLKNIHPGNPADQGKFIAVPADFHKGPSMFEEDRYTFIYGEDMDNKIKENCNSEMMECLNGTEVTKGMMKFAEGHIWNNGMVAYNKNNIIIRGKDNEYGQPGGDVKMGFVRAMFSYNRLGVAVMKQYIVPELIRSVNEGKYGSKSDPLEIENAIVSKYETIYQEKYNMLHKTDILKDELFVDAPPTETLNKPLDPKDRRIDDLEKKVRSLTSKLKQTLEKVIDLEDLMLDISIKLEKINTDH